MCSHMERTETGSPHSKLQKLDYPAWQTGGSGFIGTDGYQGHHRALTRSSSSSQAMSG
jgi:hypothetical protein